MRALILVDETMHTYLAMDLEFRRQKLFGMVRAISDIDEGTITERSELHEKMKTNGVQFPTDVDELDLYQKPVEFATSFTKEERKKAILTENQPESLTLINQSEETRCRIEGALAAWDKNKVMGAFHHVLIPSIMDIFVKGTPQEFSAVLGKSIRK